GRPHAVTGSDDRSVRVWDLTTGTQTHHLTGHTDWVKSVAVTRIKGRPHAVTGSDDRSVRVWDLTTGTQTHHLTGHTSWVNAVAVTHIKGRPHAVTGSNDHSVQVWDLTTGTCLTSFHLSDAVWALGFTGDGTVVVGFGHEVAVLCLDPLIRRLL
ncbi:WD40 repeat domain-containing protein, partial [Kitasatospora sp. NPDC094019]|uniref:WD40 repeat domain-containing protein n=1 Tax=Kitasatospora sp. NPDC094019 TaxID=3364091 RepID=UPI00381FD27D